MQSRSTAMVLAVAALCVLSATAFGYTIVPPPGEVAAQLDLVSSNGGANPPFTGININNFLGANRFYTAGYTGGNSVAANAEAGNIWGTAAGHESLTHVTQYTQFGAPVPNNGETDMHATWVGMMIGGRLGGQAQGEWQRGMAYGATLWSGSIVSTWNNLPAPPYSLSFNFNNNTFFSPYGTYFQTGIAGRTADVVNSSWGDYDPSDPATTSGSSYYTQALDALANQNPLTVFVCSAGNSGANPNTVGGPASGHNSIAAAALTSDTSVPAYDTVAGFSSRGPSDYWDPINGYILASVARRATVDLAAPGTNLTSAFYGGATGGNSGNPAPVPGVNLYTGGLGGTSFAAPIIAGGVALVDDAGYALFPANPNARDARVVKAVLLNAADKIAGWTNNQTAVVPYTTTQSLDWASGAGRMNLDRSFDQYVPAASGGQAGTTDVPGLGGGNVDAIGWDYGLVLQNAPNDYYLRPDLFDPAKSANILAGTNVITTLDWFRDRSINLATQAVTDDSFDNLDLQVWLVVGGIPVQLIASSNSTYNDVEHLYFTAPQTAQYMIRVVWTGEIFDEVGDLNQEYYGLAWWSTAAAAASGDIPEPTTLALLALGGLALARRQRRKPPH